MRDVERYLTEIRDLFAKLKSLPQDQRVEAPGLLSHVDDYADQPERLRRYARTVIPLRMRILSAANTLTTQGLVQTFLSGVDTRSPYPLLLAARAQMELFSVVADVVGVIRDNTGEHADRYLARVRKVDQALIKATFGTRMTELADRLPNMALSRLRPPNESDLKLFEATNVKTRLEKLSKSGLYPSCNEDYERLCDFVHPNWGMNMLLTHEVPGSDGKVTRISLASDQPYETALAGATEAMARSATGTAAAWNLTPPFGLDAPVFRPRSPAKPAMNRAARRAKKNR